MQNPRSEQQPRFSQYICFGLFLGAICSLTGCGGQKYASARLEGQVTVGGREIERGNITFTPLQSGRGLGTSAVIEAGHYVAQNVPQGKVRVDFHAVKETGRTVTQFGKAYPETVNLIPDKYAPGLEIEVVCDNLKQDFSL